MKFGAYFTIYISTQTKKGHRYITYSPTSQSLGHISEHIYIALPEARHNKWQTFKKI